MKNNEPRYNQQIRKYVVDLVDNLFYKYGSYDEAFNNITEYYFQLYDGVVSKPGILIESLDDPAVALIGIKVFYSFLCQVLYLDTYKQYAYKHRVLNENLDDVANLVLVDAIEDYDDLNSIVSTDPSLFATMLNATYDFHEASGLSKILMVRSLNDEENEKLLNIAPVHKEDLDYYGKNNPINKERLAKNFLAQQKTYEGIFGYDHERFVVGSFSSFIMQLANYDKDNAIRICLELAWEDYLASKYLRDVIIDNEVIVKHIDFYENTDRAHIIARLLTDEEFLFETLVLSMDKLTTNEYAGNTINDIIADEEIVRKVRRKLK